MALTAEEIDGLVVRVQGGDRQAFWDLILQVQQDLRVLLSVLAPSTDLVEEILQATFLRCHDILPKYEPRGTFRQWLKGIARNLLHEELRARARLRSASGNPLEAIVAEACLGSVEDSSTDVPEKDPALRECMDRLPPHSRQLLERRYAQNLPLNRIAQQFKKPAEGIAVALFRIREALRQCLEAKGARA
jgi:RNA polymerase sigma-70 factor, ECF subfamily